MAFDKVPYLEWAHLKPNVKYNLSGSSVGVTEPEDLDFKFEGLRFSGPNQYGYVPLLDAIAGRYGMNRANVTTASGTSMANFLVCAALIGSGDEVIVEKPCYGPLLDLPRALGARVKRLERRFETGYEVDIRELRKLASRKTRLILLSDLHNPSGVKIPLETLEGLADLADTLKAHVLIDEVYLDFMPEKAVPTSATLSKHILSTNSLTKVYGLDGLRCGWILAHENLASRLWRVRDFVDANGPFPAEVIAARLFDRLPEILERAHAKASSNFPLVKAFVESRPELSWVPPDGGMICFPKHRRASELNARFKDLVRDYDTLVVPGRFFETRSHFRVGYGIPQDILKRGLENLASALDR